MAAPVTKRRFTVAEYHRMAETCILGPEDRVELTPLRQCRPASAVHQLLSFFVSQKPFPQRDMPPVIIGQQGLFFGSRQVRFIHN